MNLSQRLFARTAALDQRHSSLGLIVLLLTLGAGTAWACWATLDEQIRARGKIIVSSRSQVIQIVDGGVLERLHVKEGDLVREGDLLAELQTIRFQASADEVGTKVFALRAASQRLEAELLGAPLKFSADLHQYPDIIGAQQRLYDRRTDSQREEQQAIARSVELAEQELQALETLQTTGDAALSEVIRLRRQVSEMRATAVNKRNAYRQEAQSELAKSRAELEQSEQLLTQKREALQATRLRAPMSGIVNNVSITTIGAVLRAGDELLRIVPSDDPLIVEVKVPPHDVAFVRKGLPANVKLDAYDYSIYGSLHGSVEYISPDTVEDENPRKDEEPSFRVHIRIAEVPAQAGRKHIEMLPGLTATAEIITGTRTVAHYLLKPLRRAGAEALTER